MIIIRSGGRYGVRIGGGMESFGGVGRYKVIIPVEPKYICDVCRKGNEAVLEDVLLVIHLEYRISNNNNRAG